MRSPRPSLIVRSPAGAPWRSPRGPGPAGIVLIIGGQGDEERLRWTCAAARRGGIAAVQVREPSGSARQVAGALARAGPVLPSREALLSVNDRDAALVCPGCAGGGQVGGRALPARVVRKVIGPDARREVRYLS
jgi:thiamine monophosphate synthase